jgi:hypothetical protein
MITSGESPSFSRPREKSHDKGSNGQNLQLRCDVAHGLEVCDAGQRTTTAMQIHHCHPAGGDGSG